MTEHERMNKALRVGRVDPLVLKILSRLAATKLTEHFRVVGTHAVYAYEAEAGLRVIPGAVATQDIDLVWDVRKCVHFATQLKRLDTSMLGVLKKVDPSFRIRPDHKYTAVNKAGFEVDIIRRQAVEDSPSFSSVIVASNGKMARMNTIHPLVFARLKR